MGANRRGQGGDRRHSSVFIAPLSPPQRRNPLLPEKSRYVRKTNYAVAPIWRDTAWLVERAAWGARLRTRKVTGRDASLPAPLLAVPFELVARETVGALPQTPAGAPPLHPARGNFPLDPFRAIELVAFPILLPRVYSSFAACSMFFRAAESISFTRLS